MNSSRMRTVRLSGCHLLCSLGEVYIPLHHTPLCHIPLHHIPFHYTPTQAYGIQPQPLWTELMKIRSNCSLHPYPSAWDTATTLVDRINENPFKLLTKAVHHCPNTKLLMPGLQRHCLTALWLFCIPYS